MLLLQLLGYQVWVRNGSSKQNLDMSYFEPYLKPRYKDHHKSIFPFSHILDRYAPMMRIIMKYFTREGRFSRLYSYHIRLLMNFTRVRILHIRYYLYRSIEKMAYIVHKRDFPWQMQSLFHHSLIKMVVMHQLQHKGIPWETFISHEVFTTPQGH